MHAPTAILLISCPDRKGLVARTAQFVASHSGNIVHADHHIDDATGLFLMRLEWELEGFALRREDIVEAIGPLVTEIEARWQLHYSDEVPRVSIWVGRQAHCLGDLVLRQRVGELRMDVPLVISNHPDLAAMAREAGLEFVHVPTSAADRHAHESEQLRLLRKHRIDLVVLGKYMQLLTPEFLADFPTVINIHHSFLPAFAGKSPYRQAYERGVKIIGATAHYVTPELDAGPIIEQDTVRVSHRDSVDDLVRKGRDLERVVLARAVRMHLENRVIVHGNRTSVFD